MNYLGLGLSVLILFSIILCSVIFSSDHSIKEPSDPLDFPQMVRHYARTKSHSKSTPVLPVPVLCILAPRAPNGLMNQYIGNKPLYHLGRMLLENREGNHSKFYQFFNVLAIGPISDKALFNAILQLSFLLTKRNAFIILETDMETDLLIKQSDHWVWNEKYFNAKEHEVSVIVKMIYQFADLDKIPYIQHVYNVSEERYKEIRKAYGQDKHFTVVNVTSAIHGILLKMMFPTIGLRLGVEVPPLKISEEYGASFATLTMLIQEQFI